MKYLEGMSYDDLMALPQEYYDKAIVMINEQNDEMESL